MKNILTTGALAIILTSSSIAGMSVNSFETKMSNYTKEMTNKPYTDHVLLAYHCPPPTRESDNRRSVTATSNTGDTSGRILTYTTE